MRRDERERVELKEEVNSIASIRTHRESSHAMVH